MNQQEGMTKSNLSGNGKPFIGMANLEAKSFTAMKLLQQVYSIHWAISRWLMVMESRYIGMLPDKLRKRERTEMVKKRAYGMVIVRMESRITKRSIVATDLYMAYLKA